MLWIPQFSSRKSHKKPQKPLKSCVRSKNEGSGKATSKNVISVTRKSLLTQKAPPEQFVRRMSDAPPTSTSQSQTYCNTPPMCTAMCLQFVLQYCLCPEPLAKGNAFSTPFVSLCASKMHRTAPSVWTTMLLGKSWCFGSPGCSTVYP